jgi:hypothetical protein
LTCWKASKAWEFSQEKVHRHEVAIREAVGIKE